MLIWDAHFYIYFILCNSSTSFWVGPLWFSALQFIYRFRIGLGRVRIRIRVGVWVMVDESVDTNQRITSPWSQCTVNSGKLTHKKNRVLTINSTALQTATTSITT